MSFEQKLEASYQIPENITFRDYDYFLWKYYDSKEFAHIEACGVRDGYAKRMYGVDKARVKRQVIDGVTFWCVYTR
tara:strand:- start:48 stop:275 length:228 start_codon:yes stop_codon:yes gene_type:complete